MARIRKEQIRNSAVSSQASPASITPDCSQYGVYDISALVNALTINAPTNVQDGDFLTIRIQASWVQTLTWNSAFVWLGTTLSTATVAGKVMIFSFAYSLARTRWELLFYKIQDASWASIDGDYGDFSIAWWVATIKKPILTKSNMSANNSPLFTVINKFDTLQTNFYWGGTVALDTTNEAEWTWCMELTLTTSWNCWPRVALPWATNFLKKSFTLKVKASDWSQVSSAEILFATEAGFSNYFIFKWKDWVGSNWKLVTPPSGEWIERTFNPWDFPNWDKVGTPNWSAITHYIIRGQASSGTPKLSFDDFNVLPCNQKPMICVTFDDGLLSSFTNGKPKLDQYNIKASWHIIWNEQTPGTNMESVHHKLLSRQGHDICGHGGTNMTTLTQSQRIADLQAMKKFIADYRGNDHYALPNWAYNDAVIADILPYFSTISNVDWLSNTKEYTPAYMLNRFSPDSSTWDATMEGWVDNAIANGNSLLITIHWIVASGATWAQINQSSYDNLMDHIWTKKNAGLVDTGTLSDYYWKPVNTPHEMWVVVHWSTASTPRPFGYSQITWVWSVEPTNATDNDTWLETP